MIRPEQLDKVCQNHAPQPRTAPKLTATQVVTGLVYHQLHPSGTLAQNAGLLYETGMSDSAFSQRRRGLPLCLCEQIAATALRPMADPVVHPEAFYHGLRLVGVDGTQCSVSNTIRADRSLAQSSQSQACGGVCEAPGRHAHGAVCAQSSRGGGGASEHWRGHVGKEALGKRFRSIIAHHRPRLRHSRLPL